MPRKESADPTRLDDLKRLREVLWESIEEAPHDKRAPLVARLESVIQQIEALAPSTTKAGDPIDEVAARRAARGGATSRLGHSAGGKG